MYMSLKEYCEQYDERYNKLYVIIYEYEKMGMMPIFAKREGSSYYIDQNMITYYADRERAAWSLNTERLYWLLTEWIGLSHTKIASKLASMSSKYTDKDSWSSHISNKLFRLPRDVIYSPDITMNQEFARHGMKIVLDYWFEHYETFDNPNYQDFDWDSHIAKTAWIRYQEAV